MRLDIVEPFPVCIQQPNGSLRVLQPRDQHFDCRDVPSPVNIGVNGDNRWQLGSSKEVSKGHVIPTANGPAVQRLRPARAEREAILDVAAGRSPLQPRVSRRVVCVAVSLATLRT